MLQRRRRRLRDAGLPVLQCSLAAGVAFLLAREVLGHPLPFFAPIACVLVLGVSVSNRLRRSVELAVGVSLGVAVGDLIVVVIGTGWWQISVVVGLALLIALLFDAGVLLLNQAAVSAVLVATLQPPGTEGSFSRWTDTLVGCAVGLLVAAFLPSHPLTGVRRDLDALLDELRAALDGVADALEAADLAGADRVLDRARATQGRVDAASAAVTGGFEITAIAPLRRRHRGELARLRDVVGPIDLALRNTRVLVRRARTAIDDGEACDPALVVALRALARAVDELRRELATGEATDGARCRILDAAACAPAAGGGYSAEVVLAQLRSVVVDLVVASGVPRDEARDAAGRARGG